MLSENVVEAIGNTPLVRLRLGADRDVEVYAKLELANPFAMKDRVARQIITHARSTGQLAEGAVIVESSSGTMALGVALVGTWLGHPVHIVTDPRIDAITLAKLRALGCEVHVVEAMDQHGWQGARLTRLREIMDAHPGAFWPRQYENPQNPAAYAALAQELVDDLDDGRRAVDVLVGAVGSGGSLCGTGRVLRSLVPGVHVVGVDCVGSVLFGQPDWPQRLQSGLGNSLHPPNLDLSLLDEVHWLNDREAFGAARELAREEKIFAGNTSGSVYRVMGALAERVAPGARIVGIFPDRGDRYAENVHDDAYWAAQRLDSRPLRTRPEPVAAGTTVHSWSFRLEHPGAPWPTAVFLESNTTGTGMLALQVASRLGLDPTLLTNDPARYRGLADTPARVVRCDTADDEAVRAALRGLSPHRIAGLLTTSEFSMPLAARLATGLGLPAADPDAVATCRDKGRLREALAAAGVPQPAFAVVRTAADAGHAARRIGTPCVVKPVDESGSTMVLRCDSPEAAARHAARILAVRTNGRGQPTAGAVLVEEYLDGPEYSVEMFGGPSGPRLLGVVEKWVTGEPGFVEHRHVLPAGLDDGRAGELADVVRRALEAVGFRHGPSHTEVKAGPDGIRVVEVNPRLAGGMIPELFRLTTGSDLLELTVRQAVGLDVPPPGPVDGCAGIQFLLAPEAGVLAGVTGIEEAGAVPGVEHVRVTVAEGSPVRPARDAYDRIGHVIARAGTRAEVLRALDRAREVLAVRVEAPASEIA